MWLWTRKIFFNDIILGHTKWHQFHPILKNKVFLLHFTTSVHSFMGLVALVLQTWTWKGIFLNGKYEYVTITTECCSMGSYLWYSMSNWCLIEIECVLSKMSIFQVSFLMPHVSVFDLWLFWRWSMDQEDPVIAAHPKDNQGQQLSGEWVKGPFAKKT